MKYQSLRCYKNGKKVLDNYIGGAKIIEPYHDKKHRLMHREFQPTSIIYVFEEKKNVKKKVKRSRHE